MFGCFVRNFLTSERIETYDCSLQVLVFQAWTGVESDGNGLKSFVSNCVVYKSLCSRPGLGWSQTGMV